MLSVLHYPEKCFLCSIFGIVVVPDHGIGDLINKPGVLANQGLNRLIHNCIRCIRGGNRPFQYCLASDRHSIPHQVKTGFRRKAFKFLRGFLECGASSYSLVHLCALSVSAVNRVWLSSL